MAVSTQSDKYAREIGSFPQLGRNIKHIFELPPRKPFILLFWHIFPGTPGKSSSFPFPGQLGATDWSFLLWSNWSSDVFSEGESYPSWLQVHNIYTSHFPLNVAIFQTKSWLDVDFSNPYRRQHLRKNNLTWNSCVCVCVCLNMLYYDWGKQMIP